MSDVLKLAKESIDLGELGIEYIRPRKAVSGGLLLEISGQESSPKADKLAERLRALPGLPGVKVSRPIDKVELRLSGLDQVTSARDVGVAIAQIGGCSPESLTLAEVKMDNRGRGSLWVRCPRVAAMKAVGVGRIKIGWAMARVELTKARLLQCFRYLGFGHTISGCRAMDDRRGLCYQSGETDHRAAVCTRPSICVVCKGAGRPADHRMGEPACKAPRGAPKVRMPGQGKPSAPGKETGVGDKKGPKSRLRKSQNVSSKDAAERGATLWSRDGRWRTR